jgi:hypothetical protein
MSKNKIMLAWNVQASDDSHSVCGYAPLGCNQYGETTEQTRARHDRIIVTTLELIEKHHPVIIAFQEMPSPPVEGNPDVAYALLPRMIQALKEKHYECQEIKDDNAEEVRYMLLEHAGCVTFHQSEKLTWIDELE